MLDQILIKSIFCNVRLGVLENEKKNPQPIEIDVSLELTLEPASNSDALEMTVDYASLTSSIQTGIEATSYSLLESVAEHVCSIALSDPKVERVNVEARKFPKDMKGTIDHVSVILTRSRDH